MPEIKTFKCSFKKLHFFSKTFLPVAHLRNINFTAQKKKKKKNQGDKSVICF
jgi:hypothetical protein